MSIVLAAVAARQMAPEPYGVGETEALRAALEEANAEIVRLQARVTELSGLVEALYGRCLALEGQSRQQAQALFGRKSEQSIPAETVCASEGEPTGGRRGQRRGSQGHGRHRQDRLPEVHRHHACQEADLRCARCGTPYTPCGEETSEQIDWVPGLRKIVHHRQRYVQTCACDGVPRFRIAPLPAQLIPKGLHTPRVIAKVLVDKFLWAQPLHRIATAWALEGAHLAPGTLVGVFRRLQPLLAPLAEVIAVRNRLSPHLHVDETRWRNLWVQRGENGWLWVFVGTDTTVYVLADSRAHDVVLRYLGLREGEPAAQVITLICDFMKAYDALRDQVDRARCWAHYRRLVLDCRTRCPDDLALGRWVEQWMEMVNDLFHLWHQRRDAAADSPEWADADLALRGCVEEMQYVRAEQLRHPHLPTDARRVLALAAAHHDELTRCVEDPDIPPDNNHAERALRTPVNDRKNFYGSGAPWAARFAAQMWTVLMTVRQNGLNPLTFLIAYLTACAEAGGRVPEGLERFWPWALSAEDRTTLSQPPEVEPG